MARARQDPRNPVKPSAKADDRVSSLPDIDAEEYGVEAWLLARLEVEAELAAAAGLEGERLEARLHVFTAGLLAGLDADGD